ncbi:MAG: TGS domain-containing protein [Desulfurococcales archaeon]|nr:TGS domain-containing protein [Desulfurococcales archaeon]
MVTNLPAEARAKWIKVMEAKTPEEKIKALEEFLSAVPKHKGTANLRLWASKRLAELRELVEERRRRRAGRGPRFFIEKEGAAQVVVIGPPNTGKSSIVKLLTGAKTKIASYPMSTNEPVPGMLRYKDVLFQLVDSPPLIIGRSSSWNSRVIGLIRNTDAVIIVLDLDDPVHRYLELKNELESSGILLYKPRGRVVIERSRSGKVGIRVTIMGKLIDCTIDDIRKLLESYRIYNAHVKVYGEVTINDVEQALLETKVYKPSIIIINKADLNIRRAVEYGKTLWKISENTPVIVASVKLGKGFEKIGEIIFKTLDLIRVYTKEPNGEIAEKPLILRKGATVFDVAKSIHKDFVKAFQYAKIWGKSVKYPGERVGMDHVLEDGDIVEIHTKI